MVPSAAVLPDGIEVGTQYAAVHGTKYKLHSPSSNVRNPFVAIALLTGMASTRAVPETVDPSHVIAPPPLVTQLAFIVLILAPFNVSSVRSLYCTAPVPELKVRTVFEYALEPGFTNVTFDPTLIFEEKLPEPATSRVYPGDVVPTPKRPFVVSTRTIVVESKALLFLTLNP